MQQYLDLNISTGRCMLLRLIDLAWAHYLYSESTFEAQQAI